MRDTHELLRCLHRCGGKIGYPKNKDYNNGNQEGFGYYQVTMKNGKRQSTARASSIRPATGRTSRSRPMRW